MTKKLSEIAHVLFTVTCHLNYYYSWKKWFSLHLRCELPFTLFKFFKHSIRTTNEFRYKGTAIFWQQSNVIVETSSGFLLRLEYTFELNAFKMFQLKWTSIKLLFLMYSLVENNESLIDMDETRNAVTISNFSEDDFVEL